jgi:hypothetical protein
MVRTDLLGGALHLCAEVLRGLLLTTVPRHRWPEDVGLRVKHIMGESQCTLYANYGNPVSLH